MITKYAKLATCIGALLAFSLPSFADEISGAISFTGSVTLNTGSAGTATSVTSWSNPKVQDADGDFALYTVSGAPVSFTSPWSFNSGPVSSFWSVGGFTFDLTSSSIDVQSASSVSVVGTGILFGNLYTPTVGTWSFTTQNPSIGTTGRFSFSASGASVPDGGTTALLVGAALVGISIVMRRRVLA